MERASDCDRDCEGFDGGLNDTVTSRWRRVGGAGGEGGSDDIIICSGSSA